MKTFYLYLFFIVFLTITDGKCIRKAKIVAISTGTSAIMCNGYCRQSINITSNPSQLTALKGPNPVEAVFLLPLDGEIYVPRTYPTLSKEYPYALNEWEQLISLVDSKAFRELHNVIGCPDCYDGGAEWIEINWTDTNKRVTFDFGKLIKGFEGLINRLRQLREQYVQNL